MIFSPVNLMPSNQAIDPLVDNLFSWTNRGSTQSSFRLKILNNDTSALIYDSTQITSSASSHTVPSSTLTAGINYKWNVQVWFGTSTATSQFSFIASNSAPTITFTSPNFSSPPVVLAGQNFLFTALYSQAEDISISKYKFILYDINDNIIEDTGYIYGFTPEFEFTGMIREDTYHVEAIAVSQNGLSCTTGMQEFSIDAFTIPNTVPAIDITPDNCEASINVSWADLKLVTPVVSGTYSYVPGKFDEGILLDTGTTIDYQELVIANDNILSGWYKFTYGQDGDFVQFGIDIFGGFDSLTQRFYIRNDLTYTYSSQFGLYTWADFGVTTWEDWTLDWTNPGFDPTELTNHWFFICINNTNSMTAYFDDVLAFVLSTGVAVTNSFSSIKFTGKLLLDNMRANNKSMTFSEIEAISKITPQLWQVPTNWLANFENTLEAGNIDNSVPIIGWRLKRRKTTDLLFTTISDFPKDTRDFTDRTPANNTEYIYSIFSLSAEGEGLGLEGQSILNFFGWYLINNTSGEWFKFDAGWDGLETDDIVTNQDVFIYKNFNKFPTVSYGKQEYRTSKITAVPYLIINDIITTNKYVLDLVKSLVLNKLPKILKNSFGDVMYVDTYNFDSKFQDKIGTQPYQVSFEWCEIDEDNLTE